MKPRRHRLAILMGLAACGLSQGRAVAAAFDIPQDLGSYAVLSCQDFSMSGNSMITSEGVGGGSAGCALAARLTAWMDKGKSAS